MSEFSRLKMRCRRGLKELDVVLAHYLDYDYANASSVEKQYLNELLELQDPILFDYLLGMIPIPEQYNEIMNKLRHAHG